MVHGICVENATTSWYDPESDSPLAVLHDVVDHEHCGERRQNGAGGVCICQLNI